MRNWANSRCLALHWRSNAAVEKTKERSCEAEIHRIAGEIELMLPGA